ncbi:MAG: methionine--tRNA ligase [Treponema sp.]|nr:methionine--tRNA ligase [Treponema sp.]
MKRRLVTSALPYVNNVPHLGNLIQVLSADVFARFCRLRDYETLYICGTDEYGTATETKALEEGITPRELCDRFYKIHDDIYRWFAIGFDKFGKTSTPIHTEVTQHLYKKLDENGYITENASEQLFCESCGRFLADRYVRGICPHCGYDEARGDQCESCGKLLDPTELKESRCSTCGNEPRLKSTKHLYINLPKIKDRLESWINEVSVKGEWAKNAVQMTTAWIKGGLQERAITRDLKWGIPVPRPGYEKKVFYVWFDACIGYISITGNHALDLGKDWKSFLDYWWKSPEETELFQFIGKDNIPFHTVIFPSTLLGSGEKWTMLHHMSSSEYLNYESGKFSKTRGIGVFGTDVMETGIPADVWRFYIFYNRPEKADALFLWKDFQEKVNGELIGNLGNLVNRTLSFVARYYDGKVPENTGVSSLSWDEVQRIEKEITKKLEWAELRDAFRLVFELSSYANKVFQDAEPWKYRKEDPPKAAAVIRDLCHVVRDIAVLISPYLPESASRIAGFFGFRLDSSPEGVHESALASGESCSESFLYWDNLGKAGDLDGKTITSEVLFTKLEDDQIAALREAYSGSQTERKENTGAAAPAIDMAAAFASTLDLRVAEIVKIEKHPNAEKLYIETLDIAGEERVIVSGIAPFYKEEELLNKRIIVAYNLKPAKLRGVMSQGMLLAAEDHNGPDGAERCEVLDASGIPTGTRVALDGAVLCDTPKEINIETFFSFPMRVVDHIVTINDKTLTLDGKPIKTSIVRDAEVH